MKRLTLWRCPDCEGRTVSLFAAVRVRCDHCGQEWVRMSQLAEGDPRLEWPAPREATQ